MTPSIEDHLSAADNELRAAQKAISDEISTYPGPISGCDAQFNHLLALRARVSAALRALHTDIFVPTPRAPSPVAKVECR